MSLKQLLDVPAPAKLNLFLHVVGQRADGYHLLQSVFTLIDWCDTLHFEHRADGRISRTDLGPALPDDDLSVRAARALQAAAGVTAGVHISIDKQVPWGAGLGGGSSDAATTLLALNRLWGLHWPRARLLPLALALGADVPFFVGGRNAWVEGIGEQITPIDLPAEQYVVVKPSVEIPTSKIFSSPLLRRDTVRSTIAFFLADTKLFDRNDLQPCAAAHSQQIEQAQQMLANLFGASRMSGSGSAVFASAGSNPDTEWLQENLRRLLATMPQGWQARLCRGLVHHPLLDWAAD
jgi:4-diphosphocytidyl-2-C-methyl-D-erythritol kinase